MRKFIYTLISITAVLVAVGSTLSLLTDTPNRYLKFLDFPRLQFFWVALASIPLFAMLTRKWRWYDGLLVLGLVAGVGIQGYYLKNYTGLVDKSVPDVRDATGDEPRVSLLIVNVKMKNRESGPLLEFIDREDADVVIAMETDSWWDQQLSSVQERYPYGHEVINDATYGMVVYSKLPLTQIQTHYLQHDNVPSVETVLDLPGARDVRLFAMHPVPPSRFKDLPDNKGENEVEFIKAGEMAAASPEPVVIAGDYNDVAWSRVDRLTQTEDLLHDVRVGRGIYASYDATNFLARWPLDHVFVTDGFAVARLERGPDVGSDHFPMVVELALRAE